MRCPGFSLKFILGWEMSSVYRNSGDPGSKPLDGSKVDPAFHLSEAGQMSTRNIWELSDKK